MKQSDEYDWSLMAKDQYMREMRQLEQLTEDEEARLLEYIVRARQAPEHQWLAMLARDARNRLVEGLQWLVVHHAFRYLRYAHRMEFLDLVQEGNLGLFEAIDWYSPTQTVTFRTSASVWVRRAIWRGLAEKDHIIRMPLSQHQRLSKMRHAQQRLEMRLGREPSSEEVAREVGVPTEVLEEWLLFEQGQYVESIQTSSEDEPQEEYHPFVALYQQIERQESVRQRELEAAVAQALEKVRGKKQREVVKLRYGLGESGSEVYSPTRISEIIGSDYRNIGVLEKQAFRQLRPLLARYVAGGESSLAASSD